MWGICWSENQGGAVTKIFAQAYLLKNRAKKSSGHTNRKAKVSLTRIYEVHVKAVFGRGEKFTMTV